MDTNVILFYGYSKASLDPNYRFKARPYTAFIKKALAEGASFRCTALNMIEAIHVIEKNEFRRLNPQGPYDQIKKFREDATNRKMVADEIANLWATVKTFANIVPFSLTSDAVDRMISNKESAEIDSNDMGILESLAEASVQLIVTSDKDMATYDCEVSILTANQESLSRAVANETLCAPDQL